MLNHENGAEHFNVALGKLQDVPAQCRLPQAFPPVKGELNEAVNSQVLSKILLNVHFVLDFCIEIQTVTHVKADFDLYKHDFVSLVWILII